VYGDRHSFVKNPSGDRHWFIHYFSGDRHSKDPINKINIKTFVLIFMVKRKLVPTSYQEERKEKAKITES
jgi:hypothetical protein